VSDQPLRVLAQPQVKGDLELILGVSEENGLGYFFLVGLGGIYTEAMDMSVLIPLSASVEMKRDLLVNSRVGALISGLRGYGPGTVINELIDIGERLRNFVTSRDGAVVSIDLNPVLVRRDGCVAVDALIVLHRDEDD
jgi:acetyltransferase